MTAAEMGEGAPKGSEMDLEREMGNLESQLQECYKIAGDLATCDFKNNREELQQSIRDCNEPWTIDEDILLDEEDLGAKVRQLNQEYLDNHIKDECTQPPPGGVLWLLPLQRPGRYP